jgi:hypothetical protein
MQKKCKKVPETLMVSLRLQLDRMGTMMFGYYQQMSSFKAYSSPVMTFYPDLLNNALEETRILMDFYAYADMLALQPIERISLIVQFAQARFDLLEASKHRSEKRFILKYFNQPTAEYVPDPLTWKVLLEKKNQRNKQQPLAAISRSRELHLMNRHVRNSASDVLWKRYHYLQHMNSLAEMSVGDVKPEMLEDIYVREVKKTTPSQLPADSYCEIDPLFNVRKPSMVFLRRISLPIFFKKYLGSEVYDAVSSMILRDYLLRVIEKGAYPNAPPTLSLTAQMIRVLVKSEAKREVLLSWYKLVLWHISHAQHFPRVSLKADDADLKDADLSLLSFSMYFVKLLDNYQTLPAGFDSMDWATQRIRAGSAIVTALLPFVKSEGVWVRVRMALAIMDNALVESSIIENTMATPVRYKIDDFSCADTFR